MMQKNSTMPAYRPSIDLVAARVPALPSRVAEELYDAPQPRAFIERLIDEDPLFEAAITVASPSLGGEIEKWRATGELSQKALLRLCAYAVRMSQRATPYGLFAGFALVQLGERGSARLEDRSAWRTRTRVDSEVVAHCIREWMREPARLYTSSIQFNPCFVRRGDRAIFVAQDAAVSGDADSSRPLERAGVKWTEAVECVYNACRAPRKYASVIDDVVQHFGASRTEAESLLQRLLGAGILLLDIDSNWEERPATLWGELGEIFAPLHDAQRILTQFDENGVSQAASATLRRSIEMLGVFAASSKTPIQTDLFVSVDGTLPSGIVDDARLLARAVLLSSPCSAMTEYSESFQRRFEGKHRLVPLLELTSADFGLGPPPAPKLVHDGTADRNQFLNRLATEALVSNSTVIRLDPSELHRLDGCKNGASCRYPESIEVGFRIAAESVEAIERGEYLLVPGSFYGSTNEFASLGRVREFLAPELPGANGDLPVAELVFRPPAARMRNVMSRNHSHELEIRIGLADGVKRVLDPRKLWAGVDNNGFFLWSEELDSRIVVRRSHLFASTRLGTAAAKFLTLLSDEYRRPYNWVEWGDAEAMTRLPRLQCGRVVLRAATWKLDTAVLRDKARTVGEIKRLRDSLDLPRHAVYVERDLHLPLDLDSDVAIDLLIDQSRSRTGDPFIVLEENLVTARHAWLVGPKGSHNPEFSLSLRALQRQPQENHVTHPVPDRPRYTPGSEWVYVQLYLAMSEVDRFLLTRVAPVLPVWRTAFAGAWHFVRYADTRHQLRLRLRANDPKEGLISVLDWAKQLANEGAIEGFSMQTFEPEFERYGGIEAMERAYDLFSISSETALTSLQHRNGSEPFDMAVSSCHHYVHVCGVKNEQLVQFLGDRVRLSNREREAIASLVEPAPRTTLLGDFLADAASRGIDPPTFLMDLLHMHCNRLGLPMQDEPRLRAMLRGRGLRQLHAMENANAGP